MVTTTVTTTLDYLAAAIGGVIALLALRAVISALGRVYITLRYKIGNYPRRFRHRLKDAIGPFVWALIYLALLATAAHIITLAVL